jgi:hypothetical protein
VRCPHLDSNLVHVKHVSKDSKVGRELGCALRRAIVLDLVCTLNFEVSVQGRKNHVSLTDP